MPCGKSPPTECSTREPSNAPCGDKPKAKPDARSSAGCSLVSGRIVTRWGRYRSVVTAGCVLLGVGLALLSTMGVSTSPPAAAANVAFLGLSMRILIPVLVLVIQNAVHPRDLGVATSCVQVFRQLGGSTGIAVFGALQRTARGDARFRTPRGLADGRAGR